jgi:hypothetical protein
LLDAHEQSREQHSSEYQYYADPLPEPYSSRRNEFGRIFYGALGIEQSDIERRLRQTSKNYGFFGASAGLVFTIDRRLQVGSWLDLGMFIQNIMIGAVARGLHTCPQESFSKYHMLLRDLLPIAPEEMVVCGMSVGFVDDTRAWERAPMPKAPIDEFARFAGFEDGGVDTSRHRLNRGLSRRERAMGHREELIQRSISFLKVVKDMTPSAETERWLNENYGEGNEVYDDLARLIRLGVEEGWAANQDIDGPNYRRSRIHEPSPDTFHFSITAVYLNSKDPKAFRDEEDDHDVLRGQYHGHPYGELNMVVPIDKGAEIRGLWGWQGPGWTAPDPGSRHYPEVRGGALIAMFFLPAGRISYDFEPPK